jgi:DNA replication and repair protein RecF
MTPYVAHLSLSHFRSHRRTRLDLDGRPVALFGPNGAGKTNLMEAVSLLSPGGVCAGPRPRRSSAAPRPSAGRCAPPRRSRTRTTRSSFPPNPMPPAAVRIDDKPAPQVALARLIRIVWLVPAQDRLWIEGADGRRRFLDRMTMSFLPDHAEDVLTYEKAMRERNRLLKDEVRDPAWYGALERQMAEAGAAIATNRGAALDPPCRRAGGRRNGLPRRIPALEGEAGPPEAPDLATAFAEGRPATWPPGAR